MRQNQARGQKLKELRVRVPEEIFHWVETIALHNNISQSLFISDFLAEAKKSCEDKATEIVLEMLKS